MISIGTLPIGLWVFSLASDIGLQTPMLLSVVAVAALLVSGWLGGQLVHVLGVTQPHHGERDPTEVERLHPGT